MTHLKMADLREKFEETLAEYKDRDNNGFYKCPDTRTKWHAYLQCAQNHGLLPDDMLVFRWVD